MNSRERVRAALAHEETDRIPVDFGGHRSSGIAATAYAELKKALGIASGDIYVYDVVQQLAIVEDDVLDALGVDVIELGRGFMLDDSEWKPWVLPDGTPCKIPGYIAMDKRQTSWYLRSEDGIDLAVQKKGMLYFEQIYWPWLDRNPQDQDFSDIEHAIGHNMWGATATPGGHVPLTDGGCRKLAEGARLLRQSSNRAIVGIFGGSLFEAPQSFYRMDNYLTHIALYPDACERLSEALCEHYMPRLERWLGAVGEHIDVILFSDDLGGQNGPLISPEMYRRYFKPYHSRLWRRAKELAPNANIHLHCCGGIDPLMDDLIQAGLESVNPVQITCAGMDPQHLKHRYGDRLTFWGGGCDTRDILPNGTPDQIRENVQTLVGIWKPGGGYVFQQVHNILADVTPQNVMAMFQSVN